jgi:hypothetical protein
VHAPDRSATVTGDINETGCRSVGWIYLAHDRGLMSDLLSRLTKLSVLRLYRVGAGICEHDKGLLGSRKAVNFLTN